MVRNSMVCYSVMSMVSNSMMGYSMVGVVWLWVHIMGSCWGKAAAEAILISIVVVDND